MTKQIMTQYDLEQLLKECYHSLKELRLIIDEQDGETLTINYNEQDELSKSYALEQTIQDYFNSRKLTID